MTAPDVTARARLCSFGRRARARPMSAAGGGRRIWDRTGATALGVTSLGCPVYPLSFQRLALETAVPAMARCRPLLQYRTAGSPAAV
eukprot:938580-Alexandrium_andersonii.AAC.1